MPDLRTTYLGFELRSPLVASASPLTGSVDRLVELEGAGVGAVVLPSLFEEEIVRDALQINDALEEGTEHFAEALDYLPEMPHYDVGPDWYLARLDEAKSRLEIPVIASLNASTPGEWVRYARLLEDAGADAIELNVYEVHADPTRSGAEVEARDLELISEVRAAVGIPLATKLSPYYSSFAHFAKRVEEAGADGIVIFNRFYQPDLDLETLELTPSIELSAPWEMRLPLRWTALLRQTISGSIAATTGIHDAHAVAKVLLTGADAAMMTSALLRNGPGYAAEVLRGLDEWMEAGEYESVEQLKGSVSAERAPDPDALERANYARTLASWTGKEVEPRRR